MKHMIRTMVIGMFSIIAADSQKVLAQDPIISSMISQMSIDSMMLYVAQLSGELPVDVGNGPQLILSRHTNAAGNDIAQLFIEQKLSQFGYSTEVQVFSSTGRNVLAVKQGAIPDRDPVLLCAHYDAMPGGVYDAPGADDNGSGTAALLEAARVLADHDLEHPVIFGFWDEEEQGLVGSAFYAGGIAADDVELRAVINMDAIAYDGNGDQKARIHSRPIGNSHEIADTVFAVREQYAIDLDLLLTVPGAGYSDHASFWNEGYGAILVIEEFSADGNPFYHTPNDKLEHFDVPYYEKLARLSLATTATLAVPVADDTSIGEEGASRMALNIYPNPAMDRANVWLGTSTADHYIIKLFDALGNEILHMHEGMLPVGKHAFVVDLSDLPAGGYFIGAVGGSLIATQRLIRLP